jgi:hypothetical protein
MPRSVLYVTAALLMVACEDATGPKNSATLSSPSYSPAIAVSSFSTDAILSGNLVTAENPIRYTLDFGRTFSSISRVSYFFTFGNDRLDPNNCLAIFPNDGPGGAGFCGIDETQTSRQLDFPCTIHPTVCDSFRDGVSDGEFRVESEVVGVPPGSFSITSVTVTIDGQAALTVDIDIKPGSSKNPINPRSRGLIPVAILTTATFNATRVVPLSVRFGPSSATEAHGRGHFKDVDSDGDQDLLLHFRTPATGIRCGDGSAGITGATSSGQVIGGSDVIRTVGCKPGMR